MVGQPGAQVNVGKLRHATRACVSATAAAGACAFQNRIVYVFVCETHHGTGRAVAAVGAAGC